jgi:flagellar biosynthesis protein FlhF
MNVKRFTGRTSRDALQLVRQAFGDDAVVLSTRPCAEGVEVLAMAPEGMRDIEKLSSAPTPAPRLMAEDAIALPLRRPAAGPAQPSAATLSAEAAEAAAMAFAASQHADAAPRGMAAAAKGVLARMTQRSATTPALAEEMRDVRSETRPASSAERPNTVDQDVEQLAMSTLSFQDYVRERMLKRRQAEMSAAEPVAEPAPMPAKAAPAPAAATRASAAMPASLGGVMHQRASSTRPAAAAAAEPTREPRRAQAASEIRLSESAPADAGAARRDQLEMMTELRSMKGLIEQRFGALAFMEKLQRNPVQAQLTQKLFDCGFSAALVRKISDGLPADAADELTWAAGVLERNLNAAEAEPALEDEGGVYALIGSTGVGKTTSTAKIAAAFAAKHGAGHLGLITLDAYRVAAHEQLRTYGRILGVPVHTAHDRASLEDLLDLLSAKKMVLIDTAGMAQRDSRTRELLEMVSHRAIQKLLVVNAAAQGETIEDVLVAWRASQCRGVILSKVDEAVKIGPALDALIRHKLKVLGVANGQRVPEDWHRLSAQALVQRALRASAAAAYRMDASDVSLVLSGMHQAQAAAHGAPMQF